MSKGADTRRAILNEAERQASAQGLEGLSLGELADALRMSKSGLFAHFRSKQALQLAVLDHAAERFVAEVITPVQRTAAGEPQVREALDRWLSWPGRSGCLFVQASVDLDDRPGPARDHLRELQRNWINFMADLARAAQEQGQFRGDLDTRQFAFELHAIMLSTHHHLRLLEDPQAADRAHRALERLIADARRPPARA
jgi:AcrR family transcriptional regulator